MNNEDNQIVNLTTESLDQIYDAIDRLSTDTDTLSSNVTKNDASLQTQITINQEKFIEVEEFIELNRNAIETNNTLIEGNKKLIEENTKLIEEVQLEVESNKTLIERNTTQINKISTNPGQLLNLQAVDTLPEQPSEGDIVRYNDGSLYINNNSTWFKFFNPVTPNELSAEFPYISEATISISGRVIDTLGNPVENKKVQINFIDDFQAKYFFLNEKISSIYTTTDESGNYTLPYVPYLVTQAPPYNFTSTGYLIGVKDGDSEIGNAAFLLSEQPEERSQNVQPIVILGENSSSVLTWKETPSDLDIELLTQNGALVVDYRVAPSSQVLTGKAIVQGSDGTQYGLGTLEKVDNVFTLNVTSLDNTENPLSNYSKGEAIFLQDSTSESVIAGTYEIIEIVDDAIKINIVGNLDWDSVNDVKFGLGLAKSVRGVTLDVNDRFGPETIQFWDLEKLKTIDTKFTIRINNYSTGNKEYYNKFETYTSNVNGEKLVLVTSDATGNPQDRFWVIGELTIEGDTNLSLSFKEINEFVPA